MVPFIIQGLKSISFAGNALLTIINTWVIECDESVAIRNSDRLCYRVTSVSNIIIFQLRGYLTQFQHRRMVQRLFYINEGRSRRTIILRFILGRGGLIPLLTTI